MRGIKMFEHVSLEYGKLVADTIKNWADRYMLNCKLWYHGGEYFHVEQAEGPFIRSVHVSFWEASDGPFVAFTPDLLHYNETTHIRRSRSQISDERQMRISFSEINLTDTAEAGKRLTDALEQAWYQSFFITPNLLDTEEPFH